MDWLDDRASADALFEKSRRIDKRESNVTKKSNLKRNQEETDFKEEEFDDDNLFERLFDIWRIINIYYISKCILYILYIYIYIYIYYINDILNIAYLNE